MSYENPDEEGGCYVSVDADGVETFMCGQLGPHCADCLDVGDYLCDFPVGNGKTCDRSMCERHATAIGVDTHYCADHHLEWKAYIASGGAHAVLEHVAVLPRVAGVHYQCTGCRGIWRTNKSQCPGCKMVGGLRRRDGAL